MVKYHDRSHLGGKGLILVDNPRILFMIIEKSNQKELGTASHIHNQEQREIHVCMLSARLAVSTLTLSRAPGPSIKSRQCPTDMLMV